MNEFPAWLRLPLGDGVERFVDWLVVDFGSVFESASNFILYPLLRLERLLIWLPWWVLVLATVLITWRVSGKWRQALGMAVLLLIIGAFGMWKLAMSTLAIVMVATLVAVLIGLPIGILMARHEGFRATIHPVLDAMQTLPSFVYLIPAMMLLGLGMVPAVLATVLYAVSPVIRLTCLGIRQVDQAVVEAAQAFGSSPRQILWGVQLPLALPTIMTGINQTIMMALSMVVIASMIGARGVGAEVLRAIQRMEIGRGFEAGLSIVAMAIVIDRITQGFARQTRPQE